MQPSTNLTDSNIKAPTPLSVSQLNHQARYLLETNLGQVNVAGEVSNLAKPASGHIYFTLKDKNAQIRVAWFKSSIGKFIPKLGDQIVVKGRVSLYEPRGDYQMIASTVQPEGLGDLQFAFIQLKNKLEQEGLFNPENKTPLPKSINSIGVITSASGAAIHDILWMLKRRFPLISVILYPALVQGDEASGQIAKAIETANSRNEVDVLIVGRGGGSIEDLWAFNEEAVARAISASKLPIVSAVGHEVDFTIADFVADKRAATPSAAAELLSPDQADLMQTLDYFDNRINQQIESLMSNQSLKLSNLRHRLKNPGEQLSDKKSLLNQLEFRLFQNSKLQIQSSNSRLNQVEARLNSCRPNHMIRTFRQVVQELQSRNQRSIKEKIKTSQHLLSHSSRALNSVNPLATLERGYAIAFNKNGTTITDAETVKPKDTIELVLHQGKIKAQVTEISKGHQTE